MGYTLKSTWLQEFSPWVESHEDCYSAKCKACNSNIAVKYSGSAALVTHASTEKHRRNMEKFRGGLDLARQCQAQREYSESTLENTLVFAAQMQSRPLEESESAAQIQHVPLREYNPGVQSVPQLETNPDVQIQREETVHAGSHGNLTRMKPKTQFLYEYKRPSESSALPGTSYMTVSSLKNTVLEKSDESDEEVNPHSSLYKNGIFSPEFETVCETSNESDESFDADYYQHLLSLETCFFATTQSLKEATKIREDVGHSEPKNVVLKKKRHIAYPCSTSKINNIYENMGAGSSQSSQFFNLTNENIGGNVAKTHEVSNNLPSKEINLSGKKFHSSSSEEEKPRLNQESDGYSSMNQIPENFINNTVNETDLGNNNNSLLNTFPENCVSSSHQREEKLSEMEKKQSTFFYSNSPESSHQYRNSISECSKPIHCPEEVKRRDLHLSNEIKKIKDKEINLPIEKFHSCQNDHPECSHYRSSVSSLSDSSHQYRNSVSECSKPIHCPVNVRRNLYISKEIKKIKDEEKSLPIEKIYCCQINHPGYSHCTASTSSPSEIFHRCRNPVSECSECECVNCPEYAPSSGLSSKKLFETNDHLMPETVKTIKDEEIDPSIKKVHCCRNNHPGYSHYHSRLDVCRCCNCVITEHHGEISVSKEECGGKTQRVTSDIENIWVQQKDFDAVLASVYKNMLRGMSLLSTLMKNRQLAALCRRGKQFNEINNDLPINVPHCNCLSKPMHDKCESHISDDRQYANNRIERTCTCSECVEKVARHTYRRKCSESPELKRKKPK